MKAIRNIILISVLYLVSSFVSRAQPIEITPFVGWQAGGHIHFEEGELRIVSAFNYGGNINIPVDDGLLAEFYYSRMDSKTDFTPNVGHQGSYSKIKFDMAVEYYQLGIVKQTLGETFVGFGSFTLGAAHMIAKTEDINNVWRFAGTFGGGLKYYISNRIGIRLQARILIPTYFGGTAYAGVGTGGAGLTISSTTPMIQGDFTAGLMILLGE